MSDEVPVVLEGMGFTGPTIDADTDSTDVLRRMVEKVQAEPDGALTIYNSKGEPQAVMIHPFVWDVLVLRGVVIPTDAETARRGNDG